MTYEFFCAGKAMMKASAFEFRFRLWISFAVVVLGFTAPWIELLPAGFEMGDRRNHTWGWLVTELSRLGLSASIGFALVAGVAISIAAVAAGLRVWGTAYLGTATVFHAEMKPGPSGGASPATEAAGQVLADGPYRHVRNPLYLGSFLTIVAIALLMPPSGAAICLPLLAFFILRLILGEEAFLTPRLGEPYARYCRAVPRLIPSLWPRVVGAGRAPQWGPALVGEIFPIGVVVSFAALSWQYNTQLLEQAVLVSFGVSLVARALIVPKASPAGAA
jgi:protein-S-isoprenylcysteine O-methyltransferase Ste14